MNDNRRMRLKESCSMLQTAMGMIRLVEEEEQDSIDNIPENLQNSELCIKMESTIETLEEAVEDVERAIIGVNSVL